jgi:hypothetical protein
MLGIIDDKIIQITSEIKHDIDSENLWERKETKPKWQGILDHVEEVFKEMEVGAKKKRSLVQKALHKKWVNDSLAIFLGVLWEIYTEDIVKYRGVKAVDTLEFTIIPRQNGKTYALAMFFAMVMYCFTGLYALAGSGWVLLRRNIALVKTYFNYLHDAQEMILKDNESEFQVAHPEGVSKLTCIAPTETVRIFSYIFSNSRLHLC